MSEASRGPDRRQFIALGLGAFVVASLPLAARRRDRVVRRTLPLMGTIAEIAVVESDVRRANLAIDAAMAALTDVERTMSRFSAASDIGRANLAAARGPVTVSGETAFVVAEALRWAEQSDGAFDPAIGGAVALWDVTHRHQPPAEAEVRRVAGRRLFRAIEVESRGRDGVLRYHDADALLDLGGIAKGHGVDRAVAALRDWGVRHALVNVGGDLYALGTAPDGDGWQVGIQDPADDRKTLASVSVADAAIATSGTYQQFFRWRGRRFHHLLDPRTGAPRATGMQSLTVRADSCMHADAAATALFGMTPTDAARILALRAPGGAVIGTA